MPDVRCPRFHMAAFLYTRAPTRSCSLPAPPPSSRHFSSRLCCLKPERRWQKRNNLLAERGGKGQTSWVVRTVLNHKTLIINGIGETNPTRMLPEGLFAQTQKLEEQITKDHHPGNPEVAELGLSLEKLKAELQVSVSALRKKEEDLQDAEWSLFLEYDKLNHAKEVLKQEEEEIVIAGLRRERLEEEMRTANLALASQVIFIEDLKLSLNERDKEIMSVECDLSLKGDEIERMKRDLANKSEEAATAESEFICRVNLLNEANVILKRQEDELCELERAIQEKEEELEVVKPLEKAEHGKLSLAEAHLKQQTTDWLMAREELKKLEEDISKHRDETNGTFEDFERVRTLLAEVKSELISSQKAFALSRQEVEEKERVLEKQLEELKAQRGSIESYTMTLKNAEVEVESERIELRVIEARNKELQREMLVEKELIDELEKDLSKERSCFEQALEDISSLKKKLDDRNTELAAMENAVCVKDAELVEARLEIQCLISKHESFQSFLEKNEMELSDAQKILAVANQEISELNVLIKHREGQLIQVANALKEREGNVQTICRCSEAESMVDKIVSDTDEGFDRVHSLDLSEKPASHLISCRKQLEKELQLTRKSLKRKEMEILASQRALTIKDQELKLVSRKLDSKETELVKIKEELMQESVELKQLYALAQERIGEKSIGDLAIEKLELEAAQLEVKAAAYTLQKLTQMSRELLNTTARSIDADVEISTLPCYDSSNINSNKCIGGIDHVSEFRTEVAKLLALTEQLVTEADARKKGS